MELLVAFVCGLVAVFFACALMVVAALWWISEKEDRREEKTMNVMQRVIDELRKHEAEKHREQP